MFILYCAIVKQNNTVTLPCAYFDVSLLLVFSLILSLIKFRLLLKSVTVCYLLEIFIGRVLILVPHLTTSFNTDSRRVRTASNRNRNSGIESSTTSYSRPIFLGVMRTIASIRKLLEIGRLSFSSCTWMIWCCLAERLKSLPNLFGNCG